VQLDSGLVLCGMGAEKEDTCRAVDGGFFLKESRRLGRQTPAVEQRGERGTCRGGTVDLARLRFLTATVK
jgi:hypothetical protein